MQPPRGTAPSTPVAVVMPVRNGEAYLADALDSIFRQSFGDFTLFAIDDGSTDATPAILRSISDPRLRRLNNRGKGLVDALLTGLAESDSPLIARMDADDVALPDRFARQVAYLTARPEISLVGTQVAHIDAAGVATGTVSNLPTGSDEIARALPARGCVLRHPTIMMRRGMFESATYRRVAEGAEDYDLWLRLSEVHALANLPDVLLHYRIHDAQVSAGINWRQRFAHDLALLSARARRRGAPDPLDAFDATIPYADPATRTDVRLDPALRNLVIAYAAAEKLDDASAAPPDAQSLRAMIETTRHALFGDGRRTRARMMARAARAAMRQGSWSLALQSTRLAFEAAPGRAFGWMLARG